MSIVTETRSYEELVKKTLEEANYNVEFVGMYPRGEFDDRKLVVVAHTLSASKKEYWELVLDGSHLLKNKDTNLTLAIDVTRLFGN